MVLPILAMCVILNGELNEENIYCYVKQWVEVAEFNYLSDFSRNFNGDKV